MAMAIVKAVTFFSLLHLICPASAIDLGAPIVGCSEVDCPTAGNTTSAECKVADRTFSLIGLASFDNPVTSDDFTWTEGIQAYDNPDPKAALGRTYEKSFYLGTPQGFDLIKNATTSGYEVCALFFTKVADSVEFGGGKNEPTVGTCSDALTSACVDALLKQATDIASSNPEKSQSCSKLLSDVANNLVPECSRIATGDKWDGLQVQDLTGSKSPKPLTANENSTSNCYPTLPKTNSLTRVASFNTSGTSEAASVTQNLYSIVPILTLFVPQNQSDSSPLSSKRPEARLTCLKGTGLTDAEIATKSKTDENKDKDSAATTLMAAAGANSKLGMVGLIMSFSLWILFA